MNEKETVISTFSGPGGSSLGYKNAGYEVRAALDCAPNKFDNIIPEIYRRNHPDTNFLEQNARITTGDELLKAADLEKGELGVLDGSPPCSPFSSANAIISWGDHESGTLFDRYTYFVNELEPKAFVAENVSQLAQGKTKTYFKKLCRNLRNTGPGYNLKVQKIDAAYLGAPHHRRRLIFIGVRNDIGHPPKIQPTAKPVTVREAWKDLKLDKANVKEAKKKAQKSSRYKYIKELPADRKTSIDMIRDDGKITGFTQHRLSYRLPAPTFTSSRKDFIHPAEDRYLTVPEVQRLIGLPDSYKIPNWECAIRCLPPILVEIIGKKLKSVLDNY